MIKKHLYNKGIKEPQQTQGLSGLTKVNTFMSYHKFYQVNTNVQNLDQTPEVTGALHYRN